MNIRKAAEKDLNQLCDLSLKLSQYDNDFDDTINAGWDKQAYFASLMENKQHNLILVVEDCERLCGYIVGSLVKVEEYRTEDFVVEIEEFYVDEELRGSGYGTRLFQELYMHAQQLKQHINAKVNKIAVKVSAQNEKAISFYKKMGFKEYDLILEKNL